MSFIPYIGTVGFPVLYFGIVSGIRKTFTRKGE